MLLIDTLIYQFHLTLLASGNLQPFSIFKLFALLFFYSDKIFHGIWLHPLNVVWVIL